MGFGSHFVGSEDQTQVIRPKCKCLVHSPHLGDRDGGTRFQGHLYIQFKDNLSYMRLKKKKKNKVD